LVVDLSLLRKILLVKRIESVYTPHTQKISTKKSIEENYLVKYKDVTGNCPALFVLNVGKNYRIDHAVAVNANQADHDKFGTPSLKTDDLSVLEKVEYRSTKDQSKQNDH